MSSDLVDDLVWLRDLDGTGSMHPCSKDAPGAIEYIPADALAARDKEIARKDTAIEQAAQWFEEYAMQHWDKACNADQDDEKYAREKKAQRNDDRADFLRQALKEPTQ